MTTKVTWDKLAVEGFGPFDRPVAVELGPAANILAAPNESGKSSLLAALRAVLFGLRGDQAGDLTEARYRSWYGGLGFRGALVFTAGQDRYLVERDFAERRVRLSQRAGGRWSELFGGAQHATARRRGNTYLQVLEDILGLADAELFEQTFFVSQPLPPSTALSDAVQALLSGGGAGFEPALDWLKDQLRALTRHTAVLGVTTSDARNPSALEQVQEERRQLSRDIAASRDRIDARHGLQAKRAALLEQQQTAAAEAGAARAIQQAFSAWQRLRSEHQSALAAQLRISRSLDQARRAAATWDEAAGRLAKYPEYSQLPPDTAVVLERLGNAWAAADRLELERRQLLASLARRARALAAAGLPVPAEAVAEVGGVSGGLGGDSDLGAVQLPEHLRRIEEELGSHLAVRQAAAAGQARIAAAFLDAKDQMSTPVVARAREDALAVVQGWQAMMADIGRVEAAVAELRAAFPGREWLDPSAVGQLDSAAGEYENLAGQILEIEQLADREAAAENLRAAALAALRGEFPEAAALADPQAALAAAQARAAELEFDAARIAARQPGLRTAVTLAAVAAAALAVAAWSMLGNPGGGWAVSLAALVAAVSASMVTRLLLGRTAPGDSGPETIDLSALPAVWLDLRWPDLAAKAGSLGEYVERRRRLEPADVGKVAAAPDAGAGPALLERLAALQVSLGPGVAGENPRAAVSRLRDLVARRTAALDAARARAESLAVAWPAQAGTGADPDNLRGLLSGVSLPTTGGAWSRLAELAAACGAEAPSACGAVVSWLASLDEAWWETLSLEAAERDAGLLRRRTALAGLQAARALWDDDRSAAQASARQLMQLRAVAAEQAAILATLLTAVQQDLRRAKSRWEEMAAAGTAESSARQALDGILRGQGVTDLEALELAQLTAGSHVAAAAADWRRLLEGHPALPPMEAAADPVLLAGLANQLESQVSTAEERREKIAAQIAEVAGELAGNTAGAQPLNVAVAGQKLSDLDRQAEQMRMDVDALALAHTQLRAAIEDYQQSHRLLLAAGATAHFARLTGDSGRAVLFDETFAVSIGRPGGAVTQPAQLSQGAQDQLFIALRLAVADLLAPRLCLPLILDDPFLTFDLARDQAMRRALAVLGRERQFVLCTHREDYCISGRRIALAPLAAWPDWRAEGDGG